MKPSRTPHPDSHAHADRRTVVVIGDSDTSGRTDMLTAAARAAGHLIVGVFSFAPGEALANDDLGSVPEAVGALAAAIAGDHGLWVPYPHQDLGRDEHLRRLCLTLARHGLPLYVGQQLHHVCPDGGSNALDFAIKTEVRGIDRLHAMAVAQAAVPMLLQDIERAIEGADHRHPGPEEFGALQPDPPSGSISLAFPLPSPKAPWPTRQPAIAEFATKLRRDLGMTCADVARVLNDMGHMTRNGRSWTAAGIGRLTAAGGNESSHRHAG